MVGQPGSHSRLPYSNIWDNDKRINLLLNRARYDFHWKAVLHERVVEISVAAIYSIDFQHQFSKWSKTPSCTSVLLGEPIDRQS